MSAPDLVLDRVVISAPGERRDLSVPEFFRLPLSLRIRCVIERTATFYANGREVDRHAALAALRLQAAASQ
jgi:hypothetical protein